MPIANQSPLLLRRYCQVPLPLLKLVIAMPPLKAPVSISVMVFKPLASKKEKLSVKVELFAASTLIKLETRLPTLEAVVASSLTVPRDGLKA